ncbi:MAG: endospore germination permease [Bacillota bacterium]|nr:endospore germination permease [Bacillota bacterium]
MKAKIDRLQYFFMLPNLMYGKAIGITAGITARVVGGDAWISMTIGGFTGTIIVLVATFLSSKFPEDTIIEYSDKILGRAFSKILGGVLAIYFGLAFSASINVITLHLKEYMLTETPYFVLCLVYGLLCVYGVSLGVEVVIRFSIFGFIMTLLINITMMLGTITDFKFINLRPMLDEGLLTDAKASIYSFGDLTMAILAVGMLFPMINNKKKTGLISLFSMISAYLIIIVWPIFETGVLGADVMKQFVVVCMQQVRSAQLTRYLPRYELIMVSFFVWGVVVQSTVMLYSAVYCIKQVSGIKQNLKIILPVSAIFIYLADFMGHDHNKFIQFLKSPWSEISLALGVGLPLLLLLVAALRGMLGDKNKKKKPKGEKCPT